MSTQEHMISVIVPFYNTKKELLERCIESVLRQTYDNYECIIVDDGSVDEYTSFLPEIEEKDCRIKIIHQTNKGLGSARNFGVKNAIGEYVLFLDSDDYISPYTLETGLLAAQTTDADMVVGGLKHVSPDETPIFQENANQVMIVSSVEEKQCYIMQISGIKQQQYKLENGHIGPSACGKLIKKNKVEEVQFEKDKYWDEDNLWSIAVAHSCKIIALADILWYAYIINPQSMVRGYAGDRIYEFQLRAKQEYNLIKQLWPQCIQGAYHHIWDGLLRYCRTDTFNPANPYRLIHKYKNLCKAIDFDQFKEAIININFDYEKRAKYRMVKKSVRRLLLCRNKIFAYFALEMCIKRIRY